MKENLFVYGTLRPGHPNDQVLKNIGGSFEEGWVFGSLHNEGWGAEMGSPGIRLDANGEKVEGILFRSENLKNHWSVLDKFEGTAYRRVLTKVMLQNKTMAEAYIYELKPT